MRRRGWISSAQLDEAVRTNAELVKAITENANARSSGTGQLAHQLQQLFVEMDADGDGAVSEAEFQLFMSKYKSAELSPKKRA